MTSPRPPIEDKPICSECRSDPDEPVVKVGDDKKFWLLTQAMVKDENE